VDQGSMALVVVTSDVAPYIGTAAVLHKQCGSATVPLGKYWHYDSGFPLSGPSRRHLAMASSHAALRQRFMAVWKIRVHRATQSTVWRQTVDFWRAAQHAV